MSLDILNHMILIKIKYIGNIIQEGVGESYHPQLVKLSFTVNIYLIKYFKNFYAILSDIYWLWMITFTVVDGNFHPHHSRDFLCHNYIIRYKIKEKINLFDLSYNWSCIRIWDFHSGSLDKKIKV